MRGREHRGIWGNPGVWSGLLAVAEKARARAHEPIATDVREALASLREQDAIREDVGRQRALIVRFQEGEPGLSTLLTYVYGGLVWWYLRKFPVAHSGKDRDEWVQAGKMGVLEGCARFDLSYANTPSTYILIRMKHVIRRSILEEASCVRLPSYKDSPGARRVRIGAQLAVPISSLQGTFEEGGTVAYESWFESIADDAPLADETLTDEELARAVPEVERWATSRLDMRSWLVLKSRFYNGDTLEEIGNRTETSREWIRQVEGIALQRAAKECAKMLGHLPSQHPGGFWDWIASMYLSLEDFAP